MTKKTKMDVVDFTPADVGRLVGELAEMEIMEEKTLVCMNTDIDMIRAQYEEELLSLGESITARRSALEQWAEAHKDLFKEPRSMDFERGTIGFRLGQWQVKTMKGFTWKKVCEAIQSGNLGKYYLRKKEPEVNKEAILSDRETISKDKFKKIGVKVVQEEAFFCEIKKDQPADVVPNTGKVA